MKYANIKNYFAAANGYDGFRSYFDKTFSSEKFERIFVLKGGPGTGKSSLMKSLAVKAEEDDLCVDRIYCSSDPHSLDGIIIQGSDKKVAFLDGTAPHERDAVIPGAIDSIISLGENWDERWLSAKKDKILELSALKSKAYKTAYHYLNICGVCSKRIAPFTKIENTDKIIDFLIKSKAESTKNKDATILENKLLYSFGRYGRYFLSPKDELKCKHFSPDCDYFSAIEIINATASSLRSLGVKICPFPDPLNPCVADSVYLPQYNILLTVSGGEKLPDASFKIINTADEESLRVTKKIYADSLNEAERWFSIASDIHFRLEEIYSSSMDFSKNDVVIAEKYSDILSILS